MKHALLRAMIGLALLGNATAQETSWPTHGNDPGGTKYTTLQQINRDNVRELRQVWTWETGEKPIPTARAA